MGGCTNLRIIKFEHTDSPPTIDDSAFENVTANVYYDNTNNIWNSDNMLDYGEGTLTWVNIIDSGTCGAGGDGSNLTWAFCGDGTLTISGEGMMASWGLPSVAPWHAYLSDMRIQTVQIDDGVTSISDCAFFFGGWITNVMISDSVTSIGAGAFNNLGHEVFASVTFLGNAPTIYSNAFTQARATVYYPAGSDSWTDEVKQNYGGTLTWVAQPCTHPSEVSDNNGVEPTCTESGFTASESCAVCGVMMKEREFIPAKDHKDAEGNPTVEYADKVDATCTENGNLKYWYCDQCKVYFKDEGLSEPYAYDEAKNVWEWFIPATGHAKEGDAEYKHQEKIEPTQTKSGVEEYYYCGRCMIYFKNADMTETWGDVEPVIPPLDHVYDDIQVYHDAKCDKNGNLAYWHCQQCDKYFMDADHTKEYANKDATVIPAKGHSKVLNKAVTKATDKSNGKIKYSCKTCKAIVSTETIYKASSIKLSKTSFTFNNKAQKPSVTVKTSKNTLKRDTDYSVSYPKYSTNSGTYTVTIKGIGNYSFTKQLKYTIKPSTTAPTGVNAKNSAKGTVKVSWTKCKDAGIDGYKVQYVSGKIKKIVTVKNYKTVSALIKKLKKSRTYKISVCTYKGKTLSKWSKAVSVRIKK